MTPKISIFLPTIRVHLLEKWYNSVENSLLDIPFEVIFCGPFEIPQSLFDKPNVKWIPSFQSPNVAAQRAALVASGEVLVHHIDDGIFLPGVLKDVITYSETLKDEWIIGMPYTEGKGYTGAEMGPYYWKVKGSFNWPRVNPEWGMNCHWVMPRKQFLKYGGFDKQFGYLVASCNDLLWRQQKNGAVFYDYGKLVTISDWEPNDEGSHGPIDKNHHPDLQRLCDIWHQREERPVIIPLDQCLNEPDWNLRFQGQRPESFSQMYPTVPI